MGATERWLDGAEVVPESLGVFHQRAVGAGRIERGGECLRCFDPIGEKSVCDIEERGAAVFRKA